jgi:hypothetical protein
VPVVLKSERLNLPEPSGPVQACNGIALSQHLIQGIHMSIRDWCGKSIVRKKKQNIFTRELDIKLKNKLVKCCIWIIDFFGAESWILRKVDHKYLENVQMWGWR